MVKHNLLLVHAEGDKQRHLEVGLRRAGFNVTRATTLEDALGRFTTIKPDIMVSQLEMSGGDAYELWSQVQMQTRDVAPSPTPATVGPVFILLGGRSPGDEIRTAIDLGISDVVPEPHPLHELVGRIRLRLEGLQRARLAQDTTHEVVIRGDLGEAGPMDVLESLGNGGRVGTLRMYAAHGEVGSIIFQHGRVVEAQAGRRRGREAVFRLLTLRKGQYEVLAAEERTEVVSYDITELLTEGLEYVENWEQLREQLPPLDRAFEVDPSVLAERLADIPDDVNGVLRLLDGKRSLAEVVEQSPLGDLLALETISRLYFEEVLIPTDAPISMPPVTAVHASPVAETLPGTKPPGTAPQVASAQPAAQSTQAQSDEFKPTRSVPLGRISLTKVPLPLAKGFDPNAYPLPSSGNSSVPGTQAKPSQDQAAPIAQTSQASATQQQLLQSQPTPLIPGSQPRVLPTTHAPPPLPHSSSEEMTPEELAQAAAEEAAAASASAASPAADEPWSSNTPQEPTFVPPAESLPANASASADRLNSAPLLTLSPVRPSEETRLVTPGPIITFEASPAEDPSSHGAESAGSLTPDSSPADSPTMEEAEPSRLSSGPLLTIVPSLQAEPQRPMLSLVPRLSDNGQGGSLRESEPEDDASMVGKPPVRKSFQPATAPAGPSHDVVRSSADSPWVSGEAQSKDHAVDPAAQAPSIVPSVVVEDGLVATTVTHEQTAPFARLRPAKRRAAWAMGMSVAAVVAVGMVAIGITQDRRTGFVDSSVPEEAEDPVLPTDLAQSGTEESQPAEAADPNLRRPRSRGLMGPALPPDLAVRAEQAAHRAELAAERAEKAANRPEPPVTKIGSDATPAAAQHEETTSSLAAKAKALFRKGRVGQAMQTARRALLLDGNNDNALAILGSCYLEQGNTAKATDAVEQALSINDANADAHVVKGFVLQQQGRSAEAKAHYQRYLDLAPRGEHAADLRTLLPSM